MTRDANNGKACIRITQDTAHFKHGEGCKQEQKRSSRPFLLYECSSGSAARKHCLWYRNWWDVGGGKALSEQRSVCLNRFYNVKVVLFIFRSCCQLKGSGCRWQELLETWSHCFPLNAFLKGQRLKSLRVPKNRAQPGPAGLLEMTLSRTCVGNANDKRISAGHKSCRQGASLDMHDLSTEILFITSFVFLGSCFLLYRVLSKHSLFGVAKSQAASLTEMPQPPDFSGVPHISCFIWGEKKKNQISPGFLTLNLEFCFNRQNQLIKYNEPLF